MDVMGKVRKLQQVIVALSVRSQEAEEGRTLRKAATLLARTVRTAPGRRKERLDGMRAIAAIHEAETSSWIDAGTLAAGGGGAFDACDLPCWLVLAARAGVPAVTAREILRLGPDEMSALSGAIGAPAGSGVGRPTKAVEDAVDEVLSMVEDVAGKTAPVDGEALAERLASAMDDVPEGWMVRSARCGSSNLKALSGAGLAGPVVPEVPEVRFGADVEFGPGWVRHGNRRSVDARDSRTMESYAQGPGGELAFLARPWVAPSRLIRCDDPHRAATPFAGVGWWPLELRCFVVDGVVEGVSNYFSWAPFPATPANARTMLEARAKAQAIADECTALGALPRYMDVEFARHATYPGADDPARLALLEEYGRDKVAFTVDLLEVEGKDGPMLVVLEAGPAASPWGGGHPCGFAGVSGPPRIGVRQGTKGAAFGSMDHVVIGDPRTWVEGDVAGKILAWDEVEALAGTE